MLTTETLRDNPEAYLPRDRRRALARGESLADRVTGSAMFADISGFTPLTEALATELGPQRGAEELVANIGRVFHAVIEELDRQGGDVIYFAGDAITCWIDGDDGTRAVAAGLGMQRAIEREGLIVTPAGTEIRLGMKVAIAVGRARRFVVGDPDIQLIDVLAGRLIDDLAEAEHHAERGEIVLDPSAVESLGDRIEVRESRASDSGPGDVGVLGALRIDVPQIEVVEPPELPEELVKPWLLPDVYERLISGRGEFLAELRPAFPVFLKFGGIDFDTDDEAIAKLDDFVQRAQRILAGYGGNILQLTLGDKGAYLYGVFGSPVAHEDDGARAAAAALELRDLDKVTSARDIQVGISWGRLRSGTYGHAMRRTFVCLGDAVNLSARLMSKAPPGRVFVSDAVRQAAGDAFLWDALPDLTLKGKSRPIVAHALTGSLERASRRRLRFELPLAGRRAELALLDDRLESAVGGRGRVVAISAEAGMGKSRLVAEFVRSVRRRGLTVLFGECQSFGTTSGYFVWREIWRRLFELDDDAPAADQIEQLRARVGAIDPGLVARVPLLEPVVGLDIPDTELTAGFDAKLRKGSLEDLLVQCLKATAAAQPLAIVLEDCHWIDELSRSLLEALVRAAVGERVLFTVAYRPAGAPGGGLGLERLPSFEEIDLGELGPEEATQVIRAKLEQLLGAEAEAPAALVQLVTERSDGNPFYIEELINFVAGQGVDLADAGAISRLQLPESLHSLVLSRIDSVAESPRRTLKVASVIGRVFGAPALPDVYPELGTLDEVRESLGALRGADLVRLDREADEAYLFKHILTQEVAYESMPFAVRATLHGLVGGFLERTHADELDQNLDLLALHYWRSDLPDKKVDFLGRAANAARNAYANSAAIDYYERLVPLLDGADRIRHTIELAQVHHVVGDIPRADVLLTEAHAAAVEIDDRALIARSDHLLAESARRVGRFEDAAEVLGRAHAAFVDLGDDAGAADVLQVMGTVAAQRGDAALARGRYLESLAIRERLGDAAGVAALTNNLGIVAQQQDDADAARAYAERALALYTEIGDRRRIGTCQVNLAWMDGLAGRPRVATDPL